MSEITRVLHQQDFRKYKTVRKELLRFLAERGIVNVQNDAWVLLLCQNRHSNGVNLFLPLMVAEKTEVVVTEETTEEQEPRLLTAYRTAYRAAYHFKHHEEFPVLLSNSSVSSQMRVGTVYFWDLTVSVFDYLSALNRPLGDYSHLTDSQRQKKFNGEKARIAAKDYLNNSSRTSKSIIASRYGVSLSTLTDAVRRLQRDHETSEGQSGLLMNYRTTSDSESRKRVASVALLNVLNSSVSPSKRCRLIPEVCFKYNIPERTLRDRLRAVNPAISKAAEGIRRRKLSPSAEQFLTTFYAMCGAQNTHISVKQADAICELLATTTDYQESDIFDFTPDASGHVNLSNLLKEQELKLGKNFGWRFRYRNGFASTKAKKMDARRLKASNVDNIAMWLSDDAYSILSSTPPELIFNADEIGFSHTIDNSQKHSRFVSVGVPQGTRRNVVYKVKETEDDTKALTTVTACVSAAGVVIAPMVTVATSTIKDRLACSHFNMRFENLAKPKLHQDAHKNVHVVFTKNGYNNSSAFIEYVKWFDQNTQHLVQSSNGLRHQKRVLIIDNHYSHYCKPVLDFVASKNIVLLLLPPNTTHLLQPLDVGVFSVLKKRVRNLATEWCPSPETTEDGKLRYGHFDILCNFINALYHVLKNGLSGNEICLAFKNSGICPPTEALFNPAIRNVVKHFDSHARLKTIFLHNILPLVECTRSSERRNLAPGLDETIPASPIVPLVNESGFVIGEEGIESLDFLRVDPESVSNAQVEEATVQQTDSSETEENRTTPRNDSINSRLDNEFVSNFTFEDVLKMITDLMKAHNSQENLSIIPKLMNRLDKCSSLAFNGGSNFTITRELFLEQQTNVVGIVMYLVYFGACFLGVKEQTKIEDMIGEIEGQNTSSTKPSKETSRTTTGILKDLSKKNFFKLFPKITSASDRDLVRKIALVQNETTNSASMSQTLIDHLGTTVWSFLQGMLKNEQSVLSMQPEELKERILKTVLESPEALAKAATIRTIFSQDGTMSLSKNDVPIVSKIESVNAVAEEMLDTSLTDAEFGVRVSRLRDLAGLALEELTQGEQDSDSSLEGDTLTEETILDVEDRNQKVFQNWFFVHHVDGVVARLISDRQNANLRKQVQEYEARIDTMTKAIAEMAETARASQIDSFWDPPPCPDSDFREVFFEHAGLV
ncbi:LAMI_0B03224g1_1 [Lachancea mirantina]|uniref:LAMI_0B03224g1_1 n=1 Tax=Lachancea mirantina TaxID=1230905 RepID=A0A1G4IUC4_9SACH|nr:LAMI_0B03224g1_1 [Lachancea mirantina]